MDTTTPTLGTAIGSKLALIIEHATLKQIGLFFLAGLLSAIVMDEDILFRLATWREGFLPTVLLIYTLVFNFSRIRRKLSDWHASLFDTEATDAIEDIPATELLDWMFRHKSLKVKEATRAFGVPQYRVEALVKALKEVQVLIPGENNASVLNPEFSRQDVASILHGKTKATELEPLFRKTDYGFTSEPSAREIALRAPGFTSRLVTL